MTATFKLSYAMRDGSLIHILEAERGLECGCTCPACGERLVARKGEKRQPHFAHRRGSACSTETQLHAVAKRMLFERISTALAQDEALPITWDCERCYSEHSGNLLKLASRIACERAVGPCRPDLCLSDSNDRPVAFLEIVVTHEPESRVREHAASIGAQVVEFHVCRAEDLDSLRDDNPLAVSRLGLCTRRKCPSCGKPVSEQILHVVDAECWKCRRPMRIAFVDSEGLMSGPDVLGREGVRLAQGMGANLRHNYSRIVGERYLSNTCGHCGRMTGDFYLHDFWDQATEATGVSLGVVCSDCGWTGSS